MDERLFLENEDVKVCISLTGAELKSLKVNEKEYIWQAEPKYWRRSAPFLFPIVGTLKNKQTIINGEVYNIMQHGFLRDQEFELYHQSKNEISLINIYNEETLKIYPFKYKAIITYSLKEKSLQTKITICNEDVVQMPFNIGGHPGFNCPLYPGEKFSDYTISFEKEETFSSPTVCSDATLDFSKPAMVERNLREIQLDKELFTIDTIIIPRVQSKCVELINKNHQGIRFEYSKFKTLAIWSPYNDAPFVCLEPWIGYNDRFDTNGEFIKKDNIITLEPLSEFSVKYKMTILD